MHFEVTLDLKRLLILKSEPTMGSVYSALFLNFKKLSDKRNCDENITSPFLSPP